MGKKLWGGVFSKQPDELAWRFGQSIDSDLELFQEEVEATIAHVRALDLNDSATIIKNLKALLAADFEIPEDTEDIHALIETLLAERLGETARNIHKGRSRNDLIATTTKMWLRKRLRGLQGAIREFQGILVLKADEHRNTVMPGYTHQQHAQPITLGFHLLAYFWMLERDGARLERLYEMSDGCPLGSAALAGTDVKLDREAVAKELGFTKPTPNALDAVSDRDFVGDAVHACATIMQHLSRISQDIILWSTSEFGFAAISEEFSTGSSIMPQKRNPDFAELIRARSARVIGHYTAFMSLMKALPLGYNRDQQDDKPPLFDSVKLCLDSLHICAGMIETAKFDTDRMRAAAVGDFSTATELANALAATMPFRDAHEATGRIVLECEKRGWTLEDLDAKRLKQLGFELPKEAIANLKPENSVRARTSPGGSGDMKNQLAKARAALRRDGFRW